MIADWYSLEIDVSISGHFILKQSQQVEKPLQPLVF